MNVRHAFFALFLLVAACQTDQATKQWVGDLQPLLQENSLLADEVLLAASGVYNETAKPKDVRSTWKANIVPVAEHLYAQASVVDPPPEYAQRHKELVEIWSDRATAYRTLEEAIALGDAERWNRARQLVDQVKLREEEWFRTVNGELAEKGASIRQFP